MRQHDQARDERGRYQGDDERWSSGGRSSRSGYGDFRDYGEGRQSWGSRDRDNHSHFMNDERGYQRGQFGRDDDRYDSGRYSSMGSSMGRDRDPQDRFTSNDEGGRGGGRAYNPYDRDDDYDQSSWGGGRGEWSGRSERSGGFSSGGYSGRRGWDGGRGYSVGPQGRERYDDDRDSSSYQGRGDYRSAGGGAWQDRYRGNGGNRGGGSWSDQGNSRDFGGWSSDRDRYQDRGNSYQGRDRDQDRWGRR